MQLQHIAFPFTLLTSCFSGTALGKHADHAEMRIPPIRGHVRFWHRALFDAADCNRVWGSASGNEGQGSRVALRFDGEPSLRQDSPKAKVLPHKSNFERPVIAAGARFTIHLQRLVGCTNDDWDHAQRAVKLWLLVGGLGLRSNRAAGSVWPTGSSAPQTSDDLKAVLRSLGLNQWNVAIIGEGQGKSPDDLRETASDTSKSDNRSLSRQIFGDSNPRKPSPTKFKVIRLGRENCLLAVAPNRSIRGEDGRRCSILHEAEHLLLAKPDPTRWNALHPWNHLRP